MDLGQMTDLAGQVAVLTGASGGFGTAIARALATAGATVALVGRDAAKLQPLAATLGAHALVVEADVAQPSVADRIVERVAAECGRLDILVNNAGGATVGGLTDLDDATWQRDLDLKLFGYLRLIRAAAPVMRTGGGGRVINIIGLAGHEPYHLLTIPSVLNAGLLALTKTAADELAGAGIRVNAVNPNAAETGLGDDMIDNLAAAQGVTSEAVRQYLTEAWS